MEQQPRGNDYTDARDAEADGLGPLARAWLSVAGGARAVTRARLRKRETPFDAAALLELRPPAPVKRSTDTIVGWRLDPDWIG